MKRETLIKIRGKKTQKEFAEKLGISQQALSHYENGKRTPKPTQYTKFEEVYKRTIKKLFPDIFLSNDNTKRCKI